VPFVPTLYNFTIGGSWDSFEPNGTMLTSLFGLCSCHQLPFSLEYLLAFSVTSKGMKIDNEENYKI